VYEIGHFRSPPFYYTQGAYSFRAQFGMLERNQGTRLICCYDVGNDHRFPRQSFPQVPSRQRVSAERSVFRAEHSGG